MDVNQRSKARIYATILHLLAIRVTENMRVVVKRNGIIENHKKRYNI